MSHKKKRNNPKDHETKNESICLEDMPLAKAILNNDATTVASIIAKSLPNSDSVQVSDVSISKFLGEAFTGGRSTPVYHIDCCVSRGAQQTRQRHFVVKLVLMASSDHKLQESYAVERRFYDSAAPRVRQQQLTIPKLLYSDHDGSRPRPAICFLMNDLRPAGFPNHPNFLALFEAKRALRWISTFHAVFWGSQQQTWKRQLWNRGGFWTPKILKPDDNKDGEVKTAGLAQQWAQTVRWLESKHPAAVSSATRGLGKRLEAAAGPIAEFLTLQSSTLIHGDFKAANLFLAPDTSDEDVGAESVAVLDFQYTGVGLGAEDVAYLLFPDARGHYFDAEDELLECYHEELISQLIRQQKGGPSTLSFNSFRALYQLSRMDFLRYLLGKGWVASNQGDVQLVAALEATLNQLDGDQVLPINNSYTQALSTFVESG